MIEVNGEVYLTGDEAARKIGLTVPSLYCHMRSGALSDSPKIGGKRYFSETQIERLMEERRGKDDPEVVLEVPMTESLYNSLLECAKQKSRGNIARMIVPVLTCIYGGDKR